MAAQGIEPGAVFDFRADSDPIGTALYSAKERIAIGLNQAPESCTLLFWFAYLFCVGERECGAYCVGDV